MPEVESRNCCIYYAKFKGAVVAHVFRNISCMIVWKILMTQSVMTYQIRRLIIWDQSSL